MWICKPNTTKPLQRAFSDNAIRPGTYIIGICTMKRTKPVDKRNGVKEQNR